MALLAASCSSSHARRTVATAPDGGVAVQSGAGGEGQGPSSRASESAPTSLAAAASSQPGRGTEDAVIARAQEAYDQGLEALQAGDTDQARERFDAAVETFLTSGLSLSSSPRLQASFNKMVEDIAALEAELEEAPGSPDAEPSPVEELSDITTSLTQEEAREELEKLDPEARDITFDIPMTINEKVLGWIDIFQSRGEFRQSFLGGFQRYGWYEGMIHRILAEEGLPADLIYLAFLESTYKTSAYSRARAKGIWQFMTPTGRQYGLRVDKYVDERSHPERSTRAAARYLKDLYATFGDWHLAMAAYNTGAGNIMRAQRRSGKTEFWDLARTKYMRLETKNFVPAILALALMAKDPAKYGFGRLEHNPPLQFDRVTVDGPTQLSLVARLSGSTEEEVRFLNPHLKMGVTPPAQGDYEVLVPASRGESFVASYRTLPAAERHVKLAQLHASRRGGGGGGYHVVRRGDTLSAISRAYGVSLRSLMAWNGLNERSILRPGRRLIVSRSSTGTRRATAGAVSVPGGGEHAPDPAGDRVVYRVVPGDNLFRIALRFRTTVESLKAWNNLSGDAIRAGDLLTIYPN